MSFYLGKDNNGGAILHITNGVTPQSTMKSGVLANTTFHSSLPLSTYKLIPVTYVGGRLYNQFVGYTSGFDYYLGQAPESSLDDGFMECSFIQCAVYSVPSISELKALKYASNHITFFLDANYNTIPNRNVHNIVSLDNRGSQSTYDPLIKYPSINKYMGILTYQFENPGYISNIRYILVVYQNNSLSFTGNPIKISNSEISFGGTNFLDCANVILAQPIQGLGNVVSDYFTLIPSFPSGGNMLMKSAADETFISVNDKKIISSHYAIFNKLSSSTVYSGTYVAPSGTLSTDYKTLYTLSANRIYLVTVETADSIPVTVCIKYNTDIANLRCITEFVNRNSSGKTIRYIWINVVNNVVTIYSKSYHATASTRVVNISIKTI